MENQNFDWGQFGWTVPIVVAIMAGLFALFNKIVDKRTDPIDGMEKVLTRYQALLEVEEDRGNKSRERYQALLETEEHRATRAREREKEAFKVALEYRAHVNKWEKWADDGFPDPPGRPDKPPSFYDPFNEPQANPMTGALGLA